MSEVRQRHVHIRPHTCTSVALWLAWALSAQLPFTFRLGDRFYFSLQRGCVGAWYWSPGGRPSLGLRDNFSLSASPVGPLHFTPFAWLDAWGFGLGMPLYIPALTLTMLVAYRCAITTVRDAPAPARRARRWAVVWIFLWSVMALCLLLSARHRTEPLFTFSDQRVTIENGSLVFGRSEQSLATVPGSAASLGEFAPGTISGFIPPSRQGILWFDLIPDLDTSTPLWRFALPLWPLVAGLGWLAWKGQRSAARLCAGLCTACGYNLFGLALGSACPECGIRAKTVRPAPNSTPPTHPSST